MAWIQTAFGYAVVGGVTLAFVFFAYPELLKRNFPRLFERPAPRSVEPTEPKKPAKAKSKAKPKPKPKANGAQQVAPVPDTTTTEHIVEEEKEDAVDFARSLKKAQTGTDLKKQETPAEKPKKRKGKKGQKVEAATNGIANGVHDQSDGAAESASSIPSLSEAVETVKETVKDSFPTGAAGMMSDIGTKAAETLRIYEKDIPAPLTKEDEWTSVPTKNQKTQNKAAKQEESKKQRQRNAQKEREREMVVQAEQERKKTMEAQLRRARIARGEPAKNGEATNFEEGPAPKKSVWNTPQNPAPESSAAEQNDILDTLDRVGDDPGLVPGSRPPVIIAETEDSFDTNGADEKSEILLNGAE